MSWGIVVLIGLGVAATAVVAIEVLLSGGGRRKTVPPEPPAPLPSSVSLTAGFSFFCGLAAILLVTATGIASMILSMENLIRIPAERRPDFDLAAKVVLYASLLPAVGAMAFALAARGAIAESRDTLRGRPLYRTGILLSILTGVTVLDAKIVNPMSWAEAGRSFVRSARSLGDVDTEQGYLGVEYGPVDSDGGIRIVRVIPGSPASRAGLLVGDRITELDGKKLAEGESLGERVLEFKPGTHVTLTVLRGGESIAVTAQLSRTFGSLLALLETQTFDDERLAILKAAGADRRFTCDEMTKICGTFDFDEGRLKAIEPALPLLQDLQNAYQILGALETADAKKKVGEWISKRAESPK